ncbi:TauD/TfdA family dioxygenase [Streptomyces asoensis]|uniref:TauD/TfdA family dioxygenase n=1 Tax=Streptomyces asoensis TaxID=249586 RepID=UPI003403BB4F
MLRIDRDFTVADAGDPEAVRAMEALIEHLDGNTYEVVLGAGDVCFIDNRNVVHGRRPFHARFDGKDRWLKRVNVVTDLRRSRAERPSATSRVVG